MAQGMLGMYFNNGWGTEKDYNKGSKWIRMAAEQGAPGSQHNIGHMYFKGLGRPSGLYIRTYVGKFSGFKFASKQRRTFCEEFASDN